LGKPGSHCYQDPSRAPTRMFLSDASRNGIIGSYMLPNQLVSGSEGKVFLLIPAILAKHCEALCADKAKSIVCRGL
jgi:hypothetical protein